MYRPRQPSGLARNDPVTIPSDSPSEMSSHADSEMEVGQFLGSRYIHPLESQKTKTNPLAYTQRLRMRNHTREVKHTAHCILASRELLMLHALASNESVPRTRRRFLAQIIEPDNPKAALELALDRKSNRGGESTVKGREQAPIGAIHGGAEGGNVLDVVEVGDTQWELGFRRRNSNNASAALSPARQSPGASSRKRGKEKARATDQGPENGEIYGHGREARFASSISPSSRERRERERERRRRWSGAERDRGVRISSNAGELEPEAIDMDTSMDLNASGGLNIDTASPSRRVSQRSTVPPSSDEDEL